jgi:hypothetical protein
LSARPARKTRAEDGREGTAGEGAGVGRGRRPAPGLPGGRSGRRPRAVEGEEGRVRGGDGRAGRYDLDVEEGLELGRREALGVVAGLDVERRAKAPGAGSGRGVGLPFDEDDGLPLVEGERLLGEGELLFLVRGVDGRAEREPLGRGDGRLGRDEVVLERGVRVDLPPRLDRRDDGEAEGLAGDDLLDVRGEADRHDGRGAAALRFGRRGGEEEERQRCGDASEDAGRHARVLQGLEAPRAFRRASACGRRGDSGYFARKALQAVRGLLPLVAAHLDVGEAELGLLAESGVFRLRGELLQDLLGLVEAPGLEGDGREVGERLLPQLGGRLPVVGDPPEPLLGHRVPEAAERPPPRRRGRPPGRTADFFSASSNWRNSPQLALRGDEAVDPGGLVRLSLLLSGEEEVGGDDEPRGDLPDAEPGGERLPVLRPSEDAHGDLVPREAR